MGCLLYEELINLLWNVQIILVVLLLQIAVTCVVFGRNCGGYQFLIKLDIFYGGLVGIFFQQNRISSDVRC